MSTYWLQYDNDALGFGGNGVAYEPPLPPFNVVSDDDFVGINGNVLRWNNIGVSSTYYAVSTPAHSSMLYRKVTVNSSVRISAYKIYTNMSPANNQGGTVQFYNSQNQTYVLWPGCVTLYDSSLNSYLINNVPAGDSTTYVGESAAFKIVGTSGYDWYLKIYCDVTLSPGNYWWPVFVERHNRGMAQTGIGYHSSITGDFMALRNFDNTSDTTYPPQYLQASYMPYLHLIDYGGNEYSV